MVKLYEMQYDIDEHNKRSMGTFCDVRQYQISSIIMHFCRVLMRERQMMKGEWDFLVILIVNLREVNPCYVTI